MVLADLPTSTSTRFSTEESSRRNKEGGRAITKISLSLKNSVLLKLPLSSPLYLPVGINK